MNDLATSNHPESGDPVLCPISVEAFPKRAQVQDFLTGESVHVRSPAWQAEIANLDADHFEARHVGSTRLPTSPTEPQSGTEHVVARWWEEGLRSGGQASLTFVMLNRLAELLLRANVHIRRALLLTYPFVFLDEFQDTTFAQYDFLLSAFRDKRVTLTAVGDDKQRIMAWAGARTDSFTRLEADFAAVRIPLLRNFRSAADLVRIQHVIARALDVGVEMAQAHMAPTVTGDAAQIWTFAHEVAEASRVASWIAEDLAARGTTPRDYGILVRQTPEVFERYLAPALASHGLQLRNESTRLGATTVQDLLAEEVTPICLALIRLASERRAPQAWVIAFQAILHIRGLDGFDAEHCQQSERTVLSFVSKLRTLLASAPPSKTSAGQVADLLFTFLDPATLSSSFPSYATGDNLKIATEGFRMFLEACADDASTGPPVSTPSKAASKFP